VSPSRRRPTRAGVVSVVVVNYRRASDTVTCVQALEGLAWDPARLEVIVVDNASGDGSADRIRAAAPAARVVESPVNRGFAGGCNLGVAQASGEYVALLNNDARPHERWVGAAVETFEAHAGVACVASRVLDWDGTSVDYVGGSLTWFGMGYKREVGRPVTGADEPGRDVLFATGAAMFLRTDVWRAVGGFDERYFMFYEDVDLGWRLNLLGHRVRYVPESVAFHRHHASMKGYASWREHFLLERNALFTLYKNYADESLARVLPGALAVSVRRGVARGGDDPRALDLSTGPEGPDPSRMEVSPETLVPAYAISAFVDDLPGLTTDRRWLQGARRRTDAELLPLFGDALEPAFGGDGFAPAYESVVEAFGIREAFGRRRRVVVATEEPLTDHMAGPAIRAWAVASALAGEHDVQLVTTRTCALSHPGFVCRSVTEADLRAAEREADVLVVGGLLLWAFPWLMRSAKVLVVDVYDPFHLGQLEEARGRGDAGRVAVVDECTTALNAQLLRGDFFLCASPKQRDFWLGHLAALGRVNPDTYDDDPSLHSLVAVAPFGLPGAPPTRSGPALRGVVDGIEAGDEIILWGGGVYDWLDPLTLLRAVDRLRRHRPRVRLYFLGMRHPNPAVPEMAMAVAARRLAESLGLTGTHVFFNESWVRYEDRHNYLLEADVGVNAHLRHVETAYSFRTRMLDYLWASLPVVATEGDGFSELVTERGVGITVPAGDVEAMEDALFRLLEDPGLAARCREAAGVLAAELTWDRALAPLLEFCRAPRRAADLARPEGGARLPSRPRPVGGNDTLAAALTRYRDGGAREVARGAYARMRRGLDARAFDPPARRSVG
jgi:GT2 family glycosyltransferase/glycosyltransferase involved in cell wall biosynthesis